jgi:hypothetical protein
MTTPIFKVEKCTDAEIKIVHLEEGHWYSFPFAKDKGRRILGTMTPHSAAVSAEHTADYFAADARLFAEKNARKAGKID